MVYGYVRVSTDTQDVEAQKIGIEEKAKILNLSVDRWIEDDGVSGTTEFQKRKLGKLMKILKEGDVIIASEISRFARKLFLLFDFLGFVAKKKVELWTVKDNYHLDGSLQSTIMAFAFGIAAQIERDMISQRTKEGLQRRRMDGVILGRPIGGKNKPSKRIEAKIPLIEKYAKMGLSYSTIARLTKLHRLTVANYCKENGFTEQSERYKNSTKHIQKRAEERKLSRSLKLSAINLTPEYLIDEFKNNFYNINNLAKSIEIPIGQLRGMIKMYGIEEELARIQAKERERNPSLSAQGKKLGLSDTRDVRRYINNNKNK